jgi:endonuclease/exonuclease/phosphatase family metal-dependent hydrolase
MKSIYTLFALGAFLFAPVVTHAQLFENFESGEKASYAGASISLSTGDWFLDDALLGNLSNDKYNGSQGVRMDRRDGKTGNIYMLFDKTGGADELSFYIANYGSSSGNSLQVQYSTDGGSNWLNLGEEIAGTGTLTQYTIKVEISGNVRFKFIHASGDDRLNIDDIRITDFVEAQDEATLDVTVDDLTASSGQALIFPKTLVGTSQSMNLVLKNIGNPDLIISSIDLTGLGFSITDLQDSTLSFNESTAITLEFAPIASGDAQGSLTINSNAANQSTFTFNLTGEGFEDGDIITISEARTLPLGTRVTVTGRVTVANEFDGPLYMQDATAGIAVYWEPLHSTAAIGDSVTVTGPLTVFKPIAGPDSDFLLQISNTATDNNLIFEIHQVESKPVSPKLTSVAEVNMGLLESQLVMLQNATIDHTGAFQGNTNYIISDATGTAEMRIDNSTNLVGAIAPQEPTNVVGVIGKFAGIYQLLPRTTNDLDAEEVTFPGDSISKDLTFEIATWNIEWFGDAGNGPEDDALQIQNVKTLITTLDADVYALQEIADEDDFNTLVNDLEDYNGILATFSQRQKTAYLYKKETVQRRNSRLIENGMTSSDWANGRFPLYFQFNATINGQVREFNLFNIHAKAFGEASDYSQRVNASIELKSYLDTNHAEDNVMVIGDFNDEILQSTAEGNDSPYKNFDDDAEYTIITKTLEEQGYTSYSSFSIIDHMLISSELLDEFYEGTQRIENPNYIGSYLSTTSDHFPVWARFEWGETVSNENEETFDSPSAMVLEQNYPNPFNPTTQFSYTLGKNATVSLSVYDMTGREVAVVVNNRYQAAGVYHYMFDASQLASGVYMYQLSTGEQVFTKKMLLIK